MSERTHAFVCPECATSIAVDDATMEAIIEHGCAICGTAASPDAFPSVEGDPSPSRSIGSRPGGGI